MNWTELDWPALDRLREGFLSGSAASGPYWTSPSDLANYDLTYGERIGWKWDAVLAELRTRGWSPPAGRSMLDWGCGSGIAGRRVLAAFGAENFSALRVWDHSPLARDFSASAAQSAFPSLDIAPYTPDQPVGTLVLSHILNELSASARADLLALARSADTIIWVEPGTHAVSRDLIGFREKLRADFGVVAPCTHAAACGLLTAANERHWCHAHAAPPKNIYADSDWVKFGQRAGIDLRSLPYSFLVLERHGLRPPATPSAAARIIGEPRLYKGFAKVYGCDAGGVSELTLQKRDHAGLFKQFKRGVAVPLFRWTRDGDRVTAATPCFPPASAPDA